MELKPIKFWEFDDKFNELVKQIEYTLVDKERLYILYQLAKNYLNAEGDVVEVGVYKGGSARLLSKTFEPSDKTVHLFDTFAGMPKTDPQKDHHKELDFNDTSLDHVKRILHDCKNVRIYQGVFPYTASSIRESGFCLAHINVDIYRSVLDCCDFLYPRMHKGGIMIFDDYGWESTPGAKIAVDEFFSNRNEKPIYLPTGQSLIIKS